MESNNSNWVDFTLTRGPIRGEERNKVGLILKIKARRDVEDFMRGLADGHRTLVEAVGDSWYNCNNSGTPLEVYDAAVEARNKLYTMNGVGQPLLVIQDPGRLRAANNEEQVNLSFLKLVGISNSEGVSIGFVGAYSADYVSKVRNALPNVVTQFLRDYLVPITINLQIISRNE